MFDKDDLDFISMKTKVLAITIGELDLPYQIRTSLYKAGIKTVKDFEGKTIDDIASLPNLDYKLATIVDDRLAALGIPLANEDWGRKIYIIYNDQGGKLVVHAATTSQQLAEELFQQLLPKQRFADPKKDPKWLELSDRQALNKLHEETKKAADNVLVEPFATFEYTERSFEEMVDEVYLTHISNIKSSAQKHKKILLNLFLCAKI